MLLQPEHRLTDILKRSVSRDSVLVLFLSQMAFWRLGVMVKQIVYTGHLEGSPLLCGKWDIGGRCIILAKLFSSNFLIVKQIYKNLRNKQHL